MDWSKVVLWAWTNKDDLIDFGTKMTGIVKNLTERSGGDINKVTDEMWDLLIKETTAARPWEELKVK